MKKQKRSGRILAAAALCLLSAIPVHACAEGGDPIDLPPDIQEGICYVVDLVDWEGELLDSRICTYGERLEGIPTPDQREVDGRIYRFAGWEPALAETVTESAVYMAIYQEEGSADDGAGSVSGAETGEEAGMPEKAAFGTSHPESPQQVSATSYDVIPFPVETVSGMPGVLEAQMDGVQGPQIKGVRSGDPVEEAAEKNGVTDMNTDIPAYNEEIVWEPGSSALAEESPVGPGPAEAEVRTRAEEIPSTVSRSSQKTKKRKTEVLPAVKSIRQEPTEEAEEEPCESLTDGLGKDIQKRRQGLPMPHLLLSIAVCAGGAWAAERAG